MLEPRSPRPRISQDELREFRKLDAESRAIDSRRESLRKSLLDRLEQGAYVEDGPLTARLQVRLSRRFSEKALRERFGEDWVRQVKPRLTPTTSRYLMVSRG